MLNRLKILVVVVLAALSAVSGRNILFKQCSCTGKITLLADYDGGCCSSDSECMTFGFINVDYLNDAPVTPLQHSASAFLIFLIPLLGVAFKAIVIPRSEALSPKFYFPPPTLRLRKKRILQI